MTQEINAEPIVISTTGLAKAHKGVPALKGIDLTVRQHSIFGFLGPNGAGKTTTIKLLLGLARPTGGSATVFGLDVVKDSIAIRRRVGYLAQDPRFYDKMTARETLRFSASFFYTGPRDGIERRIEETLDLVSLADKADRPTKGFSGGERQRLGIAQAQINHPDLLILDEPAAALDPMGRRDVLLVMERLRQHTTIFYSTHILDDVQRVSDAVAILNHGALVAQAPIEELLRGSGGTSFSVSLRGDAEGVRQRLQEQAWVSALTFSEANGSRHLEVAVRDEAAAESQLLRLVMADPAVTVLDFGRTRHNLEEVFVDLVQGDKHGR
ncbi:MAG TPA: ABC transporter ATP-binding protein [Candidatus Dormibacteraeota bacterium]|nr:ABC transporter ATP-binding protein [Candidatus Dormibacteraeota bacterium]